MKLTWILRHRNNRIDMCAIILFLPESTEGVKEGATTAMDYENEPESTENRAETVTK